MANLLYITCLFVIILFAARNYMELYYELFALFFYCAGIIIPLSFLHIFFSNYKIDLTSYSKSWNSQSSGFPNIYMIGVLIFPFTMVILIYSIFSDKAANYFMFFSGLISGLFSQQWLTYLYKRYMKNSKYKKMEIYRK